ncbi:MAG: hypothetical protein IPQ09_19510 [Myxococcales bacterium]|nr:hypothetical protein [Myxococcales bacterium]
MASPRSSVKPPKDKPTSKKASGLPAALVANAKRASEAARARRDARIEALFTSIQDRKRTLAGAFWDLGRDLLELQGMEAEGALGFGTFYELCRAKCGLSEAFVSGAMRIATELTRAAAIELGSQRRALAFLDLARATPEDDSATQLFEQGLARGKVRLAKGASARQVEAAAKAVRGDVREQAPAGDRKASKKPVGNTTTSDERAVATKLAKGLARAGFKVEVRAVATRPGKPCTFAVRGLPAAAFGVLGALLAAE